MNKMLSIIVILFAFSEINNGYAFDIARLSIDDAIDSGKYAFAGFVNSASVVSREKGAVKAKANIMIERCFVGNGCQEGNVFSLEYFAEIAVDPVLSARFSVGDQILVILKGDMKKTPYFFDSDFNGGTDNIYVCNAFPYSILDKHSTFKCIDSITGEKTKDLDINYITEKFSKN